MSSKMYMHEWYLKNRERLLTKQKRYTKKNRTKVSASRKAYYLKNIEVIKKRNGAYQSNRVVTLREQLFAILGGKICKHCGFDDVRALQFDHINGGGSREVKAMNSSHGRCAYYLKYIKEGWRAVATLQVLCANCNWIKRYERSEQRRGVHA